MNTKELWTTALGEIELEVSKANFNTWFKDAHALRIDEGEVVVGVPNQFAKEWLEKKYRSFLLKVLRALSSDIRSVSFVIAQGNTKGEQKDIPLRVRTMPNELPLDDLYINRESNLNPRYDFETFVVGSFNELAHAAGRAIIEKIGQTYNPLFVYGKTGHGKTHLIQAIGNEVKKRYANKKVYYLTSERFTQELVTAVQNNTIPSFKERYRSYDMLIMDDIQFLSKKEKTQEELFHLFNELYDKNRQIIFSSDQHPNYIPDLEERLKSRFSAGMTVDIPSPDRESRIAILKAKASMNEFDLSDELADYLSKTVEGNVRELEGALNVIICQAHLKERPITIPEVRELVKDSLKPKRIVPIEEVVKRVAGFFNIEEEIIYKKTRKKEVVKPRQIIMYILREDFGIPYPTIGQKLGKRDHTTVIHSYEKIRRELENDHALEQEITQIRTLL